MDGMTKQGDVREILGSGGKDEWNGFSNNFGTESKESNNIKIEKRGMKASFFICLADYWAGDNGTANVQSNVYDSLKNASQ